jgi:site-specific DNA recombinase
MLYDEQGRRMAPSTAKKNGARYRYYVSNGRVQGRGAEAGPIERVSAPDIEAVVLQALGIDPASPSQPSIIDGESSEPVSLAEQVHRRVERVILRRGAIEIVSRGEAEHQAAPMIMPWSPAPNRRKRAVIGADLGEHTTARPIRSETRARLISGMANARAWLDELASGRMADTKAIALRQGCSERHVRSTLNLAFLAPEIVQAAVDGTLPDGFGVVALAEMHADWLSQRQAIAARAKR